jgi:hypothetical protein
LEEYPDKKAQTSDPSGIRKIIYFWGGCDATESRRHPGQGTYVCKLFLFNFSFSLATNCTCTFWGRHFLQR